MYRPLLPLLAAIGLVFRQHSRCQWPPAPHRLEVNGVRVSVLHPIVPAFEKYSGPPLIADGGVYLELGERIAQEPPQPAVRTPDRAGSAGRGSHSPGGRSRSAAHNAYNDASLHGPSHRRADTVASDAYPPLTSEKNLTCRQTCCKIGLWVGLQTKKGCRSPLNHPRLAHIHTLN